MLHIVQEALSNVRKHANATHVWLDVRQQPHWRFEIRDDGHGFDTDPASHDETHVGLRIMRERAERIDGRLSTCSSTAGRGTSVILTLARARSQPKGPTTRQPKPGRTRSRRPDTFIRRQQRCSPMPDIVRILVVDKATLFRRGLTALLGRDPHKVVGDAADAGQAQRRARELQTDLILLNHLGGVNGVDAIPALHEAAPQAQILMLTVSKDGEDLAIALRNGAFGYLLKTMEGDALTQAIHRAMAGESVVAPEMTGKLVLAYRSAANGAAEARPNAKPACATGNAHSARTRHLARHHRRREQQGRWPGNCAIAGPGP